MASQRTVELNEPGTAPEGSGRLKQYLLNASNELYLYELQCIQSGRPMPDALKRAHSSIRAELKRLE